MNKLLHLLTLSLTITALALTASQCNRPKTLPSIAENKSAFQKTVFTQDQTGEIHAEVERQMGSFALIPAGNFIMGDSFDGESNAPTHTVNVSAFSMAKNLVTKELWDNVRTRSLPHGYDLGAGWGKAANHPVQGITWYDAAKWCNACSEMTGLTPCYTVSGAVYRTGESDSAVCNWSANGYRLPSEAEWEKAARGGLSGKRFPWGDTISHANANFRNNGGESYQTGATGYDPTWGTGAIPCTSPVGSFAANGYGLYDLAGNVVEWCWDLFGGSYYSSSPVADPRGPASGSIRVIRGGGWCNGAYYCRVAGRDYGYPGVSISGYVGFRVARSSVP